MNVFGQYLIALHEKKGSMFDFGVTFFITHPVNASIAAYYDFDKNSTRPKGVDPDNLPKDQIQVFKGPMEADVNDRRPFKYDTMTGRGAGIPVEAQVDLDSYGSGKFKITVALVKDKGHSVDITFDGEKPSWLADDGKTMFRGKLMLLEVKDFNARKKPPY